MKKIILISGILTFLLLANTAISKTVRVATTDALGAISSQIELAEKLYKKSGVKLDIDILPFNDLYAKLQTMCQVGNDEYDAMWVDGPWYGAFVDAGCFEDLSSLVKNNSDPNELALDDFPIRTIAYQGIWDGKFYVIPQFHAVGMLTYRKDLLNDPKNKRDYKEKYGSELRVPQTWVEYVQVGTFFTRPEEELWGFNHRYGSGNNIIADLLIGYAYSRDAQLFDKNFNPAFDSENFKAAAEFFLSKKFLSMQPPGAESFSFAEVIQNMQQGKVAMYLTENWAIPTLRDPNKTPYAKNIGYARVPGWADPVSGKIKRGTMVGAGGYAINANSKNKKETFEFLQFMLGKSLAPRIADEQGWAIRTSVYTDPKFVKKYDYFPVNLSNVKISVARPGDPWWAEVEFIVGKELQSILLGNKSVDKAMTDASASVRKILTKYDYYKNKKKYLHPKEKEAEACQVMRSLRVRHPDC